MKRFRIFDISAVHNYTGINLGLAVGDVGDGLVGIGYGRILDLRISGRNTGIDY